MGSNGEPTGPETIRKAILLSLVEDLLVCRCVVPLPSKVGVFLTSEFPWAQAAPPTPDITHEALCSHVGSINAPG